MRRKEFPYVSIIVGVLCPSYIAAFIAFYATVAQEYAESSTVVAAIAIGVLLLPVAIGFTVISIQHICAYARYEKIMRLGKSVTCRIVDYKCRHGRERWSVKTALVLRYVEEGVQQRCVTAYEYATAELIYLRGLAKLECRTYNGKAVVTQAIPDEVYENLTPYGYVKSKFVRNFVRVWQSLAVISAFGLLAGIFFTVMLESSLYLIIGVSCMFAVNSICAVIFAITFLSGKFK